MCNNDTTWDRIAEKRKDVTESWRSIAFNHAKRGEGHSESRWRLVREVSGKPGQSRVTENGRILQRSDVKGKSKVQSSGGGEPDFRELESEWGEIEQWSKSSSEVFREWWKKTRLATHTEAQSTFKMFRKIWILGINILLNSYLNLISTHLKPILKTQPANHPAFIR